MDEPSLKGKDSIECQTLLKKQTAFCGELMCCSGKSEYEFFDAWKNNTCVVSERKLYIFENRKSSKPYNVLDLREAKVSDTSNPSSNVCSFEVKSHRGDSYRFAANSEGDKQAWIKALNLGIKKEEASDDESDYETPNDIAASCKFSHKKSIYDKAFWPGDAEKARRILLYLNTKGAYIIRKNSNCDPYVKTLMVFHNGQIIKFCISESNRGKCLISGKEFHSGDDLINYYTSNCLPGYSLKLSRPYFDIHNSTV